jgi:hypothetical protein
MAKVIKTVRILPRCGIENYARLGILMEIVKKEYGEVNVSYPHNRDLMVNVPNEYQGEVLFTLVKDGLVLVIQSSGKRPKIVKQVVSLINRHNKKEVLKWVEE